MIVRDDPQDLGSAVGQERGEDVAHRGQLCLHRDAVKDDTEDLRFAPQQAQGAQDPIDRAFAVVAGEEDDLRVQELCYIEIAQTSADPEAEVATPLDQSDLAALRYPGERVVDALAEAAVAGFDRLL